MEHSWLMPTCGSIIACIVTSGIVLKLYIKYTTARCLCSTDLTGKTVIITGANTGIGYETALDLARRNAKIILACRNPDKAIAACQTLRRETQNSKIYYRHVDLSLMKSVRKFSQDILREETRLDILINNAGIVGGPKKVLTEEGNELTFAANHFGHFLLTNLLLDLLKSSPSARVINVASAAYRGSKGLQFDNLNSEKKYAGNNLYPDTKLANVLFTKELSRRLSGTGVTVNCLHPGAVDTAIFDALPIPICYIVRPIAWAFFKTPKEGAQTTIHCAVSPDLNGVSGCYFESCKVAKVNASAMDSAAARNLWEKSERITGLI